MSRDDELHGPKNPNDDNRGYPPFLPVSPTPYVPQPAPVIPPAAPTPAPWTPGSPESGRIS
jgi:hypothetical protein